MRALQLGFALTLVLFTLATQAYIGWELSRPRFAFLWPTIFGVYLDLSYVLFGAHFSLALFCMSYARLSSPWREMGCTACVGFSAYFHSLRPISGLHGPLWEVVFALTSLWVAYALLVLGRWHFATEFGFKRGKKTPRVRLASTRTLLHWGVILGICAAGCGALNLMPAYVQAGAPPIVATTFGFAFASTVLRLPVLAIALVGRSAWLICGTLVGVVALFVVVAYMVLSSTNPSQADAALSSFVIAVAPILIHVTALRLAGLQWLQAEPRPIVNETKVKPAPNPFA